MAWRGWKAWLGAVGCGAMVLLLFASFPPQSASAQDLSVRSPVLTVDPDRLFSESALGQTMLAQINAAGEALREENRRIEAELEEEEQRLTHLRADTEPEAFREMAEAFDTRVQDVRAQQLRKAEALRERRDALQREFTRVARPVLELLMREAGAAVVLDRRNVFLSVTAVDVTETAIARIDAAGAGAQPTGTED